MTDLVNNVGGTEMVICCMLLYVKILIPVVPSGRGESSDIARDFLDVI